MRNFFLVVKLNPKKLVYLKFILEGYDHLAVLTVLNAKEGLAKIHFFENNKLLIKEILEDLKNKLSLELINYVNIRD